MFKYVAITDGINHLTRPERMELQEADEVMAIAKLSDRNLLKPGPMVSTHTFIRSLVETIFYTFL